MDEVEANGGEHSRRGLLVKLARDCHATPQQLQLVDTLLESYEQRGVMRDGRALPLYQACPAAGECWETVPVAAYPRPDWAEMAVPWVGRHYEEQRILAIAINLNKYGALGGQWWIANAEVNDRLRRGKKRNFGFRVGQYMAAVTSSRAGTAPTLDVLTTEAAAVAWESCAFTESIKCAPMQDVSKPTGAMWANCPPRYLREEFEVLAPRVVVAVGRPVWAQVVQLLDVSVREWRTGLWRGAGQLAGEQIEVLCLNHPSYGNWRHSLPSLLESLTASPVAGR